MREGTGAASDAGGSPPAAVRLEGLAKRFLDGSHAVRGVDLEVREGELLVLVGPSGSGKSTLLRLLAGLETPSQGRVWIGGRDATSLEPRERDVAMVFQSYALYPHKTVRENLAFGLRMHRVAAAEIGERVAWAAGILDIEPLLDKRPGQLSGGQRQRVALGRAIVRRPKVFLLDEPLSNLDPALRQHTRTVIAQLQRRLGVATLYVTHDQEEAMTLGHRVAVFREGRVEQAAPPMDLYRRPQTAFVASFVGSPAMNLVRCRVQGAGVDRGLTGVGVRLRLHAREAGLPGGLHGDEVVLGIRPHDVRLESTGEEGDLAGEVLLVEQRGNEVVARLALDSRGRQDGSLAGSPGAPFAMVLPPEAEPRVGEVLSLRLPRERLHFFDGRSGERL